MLTYFVTSGLSILAFYLFYISFLAREKTYHFNRYYLLVTLIISLSIPLINLSPSNAVKTISSTIIPNINLVSAVQNLHNNLTQNIQLSTSISKIIIIFYFIIVSLMLIRFFTNIYRLIRITRGDPTIRFRNSQIVLVNKPTLPFTFLHNIFVNEKDYSSKKIDPLLLEHELVHAVQNHSIDIILIELIQALLWLNPILILYKKAIKLNHEFLADNSVVKSPNRSYDYQQLLLDLTTSNNSPYLANSFNSSITKNRMIMINKTESPIWQSMGKKVIALFVIVFVSSVLVFSQEKNSSKITINGTWEYSQKDFSGTALSSSSGQVAFEDVKMVMSNKIDSIKLIKAKNVHRNPDDYKWVFENGEISTFNKFGEGKKQNFDKLEVVATPNSSDNQK